MKKVFLSPPSDSEAWRCFACKTRGICLQMPTPPTPFKNSQKGDRLCGGVICAAVLKKSGRFFRFRVDKNKIIVYN